MALYELMVVVDGQRSEDEIKAQLERIEKIITAGGGEITHSDDWGMRRLAYPIEGRVDGYYALRQFTHAGRALDVLNELDHTVRIEEALLRHISLRVPKTKKPIPIISKPSSTADSNPDWGQARRGWRPPRREGGFRDRDDRPPRDRDDRPPRDRDDRPPRDRDDRPPRDREREGDRENRT